MSTPRYKARKRSYIHDRIVKAGEEFAYDGIPSRHWTPMNKEAEAQAAKIKPTGLALLEQKRQAAREKREADAHKPKTLGKGHDDQEGGEDAQDDQEGKETPPAELTPTQKAKAILDALATLRHEDDAHWTQGGEPDLNVMKERLGFPVKRVEIKEVAPEFVRNPK